MKSPRPDAADTIRRPNTNRAAFLAGIPLAAAVLGLLYYGPLHHTFLYRYVEHGVECVEVLLFCCAVSALGAKWLQSLVERRAFHAAVLPPWDGRPVPVDEAPKLLASLRGLPPRLQSTHLVQRVGAVLEFLCQRRSADQLDDQMRALLDADALAVEGSYALTRFITWAIPILGFLGTVLGITGAISGATPEVLEKSLSTVTDGLAFAFDATALALALTMITMFCSFLVERREQAVLDAVDHHVERHLAHRFHRAGIADNSPFTEAAAQLVQRQAEVWAQALAEVERRAAEGHARQQERVAAALETALERTLQTHAQRLAGLEKHAVEQSARLFEQMAALAAVVRDTGREQQAALVRVGEGLAAQAAVLGGLQQGEKQLLQLQAILQQNLAALAGAGAFDQAVHSLTAAIHLLTARASPLSPVGTQPRKAA
jgi:biopolymer transport protein ExbB/TolQ